MCGIVGIFNFDKEKRVKNFVLEDMIKSLIHRGPDGEGLFIENNIGLGHRRLKIVDLDTGEQPMFSSDKNIALVFNGEIYNYLELKRQLISKGYKFLTGSDTEVIINSYLEWGVDCQVRFNGMWSFALWDKKLKRLFLSRDRIGEKPLYYAIHENSFFFGSEIKSLWAANLPKVINEELTELYLVFSYIPGSNTFYKNVEEILPGKYLLVDTEGIRSHQYWDLPEIDELNMSNNLDKINEEFYYLLEDSVKIRMKSEVPLGASLSGGLDSASVVSLMSKNSQSPIDTFTIGFNESKFDESNLAELVSKKFSTNHNLGYVDPRTMDHHINMIVKHFDQPFADNSAIPTFMVSNYASKKVKILLTGDGGDEVMSGYPVYLGLKYFEMYRGLSVFSKNLVSRALRGATNILPNNLAQRSHYLHQLALSADMNFVENICMKNPCTELHNVKSLTKNIKNIVRIEDYMSDFEKKIPYKEDFYKYMYFDLKHRLPFGYLPKVDRMSMANSIETRAPFLDYRLIELMTGVEKSLKIRSFQTKSILRNTIGKTLPSRLLSTKKMGFVAPLEYWLRDKSAQKYIDDLKSHKWHLDNDYVNKIVLEFDNKIFNRGSLVWHLLILKSHY